MGDFSPSFIVFRILLRKLRIISKQISSAAVYIQSLRQFNKYRPSFYIQQTISACITASAQS